MTNRLSFKTCNEIMQIFFSFAIIFVFEYEKKKKIDSVGLKSNLFQHDVHLHIAYEYGGNMQNNLFLSLNSIFSL